jgi:hypothetical protein
MSVCHPDILSSRSIVDLLKPLGYGSHCRKWENGNPVLILDYFSLSERLAKYVVRSIASPFDYARVPSSKGTGPHRGLFYGLQSRSRCRRSLTYLVFRGATGTRQENIWLKSFERERHSQKTKTSNAPFGISIRPVSYRVIIILVPWLIRGEVFWRN